jgi:adenine phosphoribosyltransferase
MNLEEKLRHVPDFPKAGIDFIDITTLLRDPAAFEDAVRQLAEAARSFGEFDYVVGPEARGFIFGSPVALRLGKGFVPVRKAGKLPAETISYEYDLEYGSAVIEIHKDAMAPGSRALIVDDLLATGGTSGAIVRLLEKMGVACAGYLSLVELTYLSGREAMAGCPCQSVIKLDT